MGRIKRSDQQLLEEQEDGRRDKDDQQRGEDQIAFGDTQDVAKQKMRQVAGIAASRADQQHAQGQRGCEDHPDGGAVAQLALAAEGADDAGRDQGRDQAAQKEIALGDVGNHDAREHAVRDRIADVLHPAQDDEAAQQAAYDRDQQAGRQTALHKAVGQGFEQKANHRPAAARRAA